MSRAKAASGSPSDGPVGQPDGSDLEAQAPAIIAYIDSAARRGIIDEPSRRRLRSDLTSQIKQGSTPPRTPKAEAPQPRRRQPKKSQQPRRRQPKKSPQPRPRTGAKPVAPPAPRREPVAPTPPRPPGSLEVTLGKLAAAARASWKSFSSDVAINSVIYLGVLLLIVVMFAFFALGFYGDLVSDDAWRPWRPVVSAALPALLFAIAAILRKRSGIPFTANAIGMVAALSLPIMLSALFQDGATWGPPDIDGPARWLAYAAVGLILAGVYAALGRYRARMYGYLVGPALWTMAGALGLYLEDGWRIVRDGGSLGTFAVFTSDGISPYQMVAVLAAMAVTVLVAGQMADTAFGRAVAGPTVRMTAGALPVVLGVAVAFALGDQQVLGGNASDAAGPLALAFLFAGGGFVGVARAHRAWANLGPVLRGWIRQVAVAAAHISMGAAFATAVWSEEAPGWVGVALVAYAMVVLVGEGSLGIEGPASLWATRAAGGAGLALALAGGWPTVAAWGAMFAVMTAVSLDANLRSTVLRIAPFLESRYAVALGLGITALVTLWLGGARVGSIETVPWIMATGALALSAFRFLSGQFGALRMQAQFTAPLAALVAIGVAVDQVIRGGPLGAGGLGVILLVGAGVAALMLIPWAGRLPAVAGLGVAGLILITREILSTIEPAIIDAGVAGGAGLVLMVWAAFRARGANARSQDVTGHLLVYAGVALASPDQTALLLGLTILLISHGFVSIAADRGRSPIAALLSGDQRTTAQLVSNVHAGIAAVTLPFVTLLAGEHLWFINSERPRMGLVLAGSAWFYVAGFGVLATVPMRRILASAALLVAGAGIAISAPSQPAAILTLASATAVTAVIATLLQRPAMTVPAWMLGIASGLLLADRLGVAPGDLHFLVFATGAAMAVLPVWLSRPWRTESPIVSSPWLQPPLAMGLLLMPVGMAFALADRRFLAVIALGAAAVYVLLGVLLRNGGFSLPASAMVGIAYAHLIEAWRSPFEDPLVWMPLAAAFAVGTVFRPPKGRLMESAGAALMAAWLTTCALAATVALREGDLGWVLLTSAVLLAGYAAARRSELFLYLGLAVFLTGGAAFGIGWFALFLALAGSVTATHATVRADRFARFVLTGVTAGLAAAAYALLATWAGWSPTQLMAITGAVAAGVAVPAMALWLRGATGRLGMWVWPLHALSQAGALVVVGVAAVHLGASTLGPWWADTSSSAAWLALTLVAAAEASLVGINGTVLRDSPTVWASGGLAAAAYALLATWAGWSPTQLMAITGAVAAGVAVPAMALWLRGATGRLGMWVWPLHALSQAGAIVVVVAGVAEFTPRTASGVIAGVLVADAVIAAALAPLVVVGFALRWAAALLTSAAATFGLGALTDEPARIFVQILAAAGTVALIVNVVQREHPWSSAVNLFGVLSITAAVAVAVVRFGPASGPAVGVLIIGGAGLVVAGLRSGIWEASYVGMLMWLGAAFGLAGGALIDNRHALVVSTAVVLLIILEMERYRRAGHGSESADGYLLRIVSDAELAGVEWAIIATPLALAALDTVRSVPYAILLAVEAGVIFLWALATEVKRRLLLAVVGLTLAAVLPILVFSTEELRGGLSSGSVLMLGAIAAVTLIVIGSILERGRIRVGQTVRRIGKVLEDWK